MVSTVERVHTVSFRPVYRSPRFSTLLNNEQVVKESRSTTITGKTLMSHSLYSLLHRIPEGTGHPHILLKRRGPGPSTKKDSTYEYTSKSPRE